MSLMIEGWIPSVGSSRTSSRGLVTSARAIASCCCWPPERSPPRRPRNCRRIGKQLKKLVGDAALAARQGGEAALQVLAHGQQREDLAALRDEGDAATRPLVRRQASHVLPLPDDPPPARPGMADDRAQGARLADAVTSDDGGDLAGLRFQRDLPERLAGAVMQVDVVDGQHGERPARPPWVLGSSPRTTEMELGNLSSPSGLTRGPRVASLSPPR